MNETQRGNTMTFNYHAHTGMSPDYFYKVVPFHGKRMLQLRFGWRLITCIFGKA